MINEKVICAGFGGQGIMLIGQLLAYAGMKEGKEVAWLPSYGPEMRGGTANCNVIVSDEPVASPVVAQDATCVIIMNLPSLDKFEGNAIAGGIILVNSSLINKKVSRTDVKAYYVPANEIAIELGNNKVANIVMLGAYIKLTGLVKPETIIDSLKYMFGKNKAHLIEINEKALQKGMDAVI
jgi:2-oxoglutarate ferredoxin oxidoreductase subunit gamma